MPPPRERDSRRLAAAVALCVGCGTQDATPEPLCPAVSDCQPILFPLRPRIDQLELGDPEEGDIGLDLRSGAVLHIHTDAAGALRSLDQFRLTNSPRHILYEDLDGDGAKDIAVTDTHADRVVVALRRADGRFADAQEIVVPDGPAALAVWSDAGGERRLLVASSRASSLWTITMRADQPPAPVESAVLQPGVSVIAAVDLDLDGVQDLVTLNPSERQVAILTHEDGSWRTTHTVPQPLAASRLRLGRFNDDQYTDLLLIDDATQTAHVLLRAPDGTFATPGLPLDSPGPVLDAIVWPDGADRERPTLLVENFGVVDSPLGEPAALRGLTSWHATSLARTPSGDGALAVVARDTGRITRASTRADALSLGTSSTLDTVGTSTPLAAIDVTGDALPEIIAHESKQLVVFPALSTSTWGSGTPLETGTEAEPAAVLPIRLDLDDHVDLLVLDKGSRISALQGLGDGTFLHPETYVLWGSGVDASVADLIGDARSEIVVTRRDLPGHPRELWQLDGSNWTSQALPGAGGRPVVVRSITDSGPDLVFASSHSDGDPAFVERVHIDAGVWHLGPRTALPAHVARSAPIEDNDSNGALAFCTHAPEDGRSSVGLVSIDADGGLSVQHQALEPTSVLHDGEALEFSGGDCQALWSEQTADTADLFAAFGFTGSEINSIYVASVFELSTSGFAHYRNDYLRHAESLTVLPLISGGERSRVLTKASLLTRLHEV